MAERIKPTDVAAGRRVGHRFGALLGLLVGTYLMTAFVTASWVRVVQTGLFVVVVLIAVRTSRASRLVRRLATVVIVGGSVLAIVLAWTKSDGPAAGAGFLWIALVLLLAVILILDRVLAGRQVTLQSIFGAISAYMVIGLMFAAAYGAISKFGGGSFFANGQPGNVATFQYFSFTTLTTVGYGDFTAVVAGGRAVAMLEALFGQIFLVTLVGKLVAAYRAPRLPEESGRPARPRQPVRRQARNARPVPAARRAYRPPPARRGPR